MPARHARPLRRKQLSTVVVVPLTKRVQSSLAVMRLDNSSRRRPRQTLRCSLGTSRHHQRRIYWKLGSNKTAAPACRQNAGRTIGLRMRQRHMCAPPLAAGTQLEHHHPSQARRQLQRRARSALGQLVRPGHRQCRSSPMEVTPRVCVPGPRLDWGWDVAWSGRLLLACFYCVAAPSGNGPENGGTSQAGLNGQALLDTCMRWRKHQRGELR